MATQVTLEPGPKEASRTIVEDIYALIREKNPAAMSRRIITGSITLTIANGRITTVDVTQSAVDPF